MHSIYTSSPNHGGMKLRLSKTLIIVLFLCTFFFGATAQTPDPGLMGAHTVLKAEYNLGILSYAPPPAAEFPANMEEIGSVHYPSDLSNGPFPVIMILHGRHDVCYDTVTLNTSSEWPCTGSTKPIASYEGYDYLANTMASHGYIVISISANSINAIDDTLADAGMNARGVLTQHHLDLWNTWNTTGGAPFDTMFVGKLDMKNIGTMGHSRGGEGVVYNAEYNRSLGSPYGIKAVFTLAPVDFFRHVLNGIPLCDLSPYCDGDVNDNEGVHFYDDSRYNDTTDNAPKHHILFMGANHDFFNTVWTPGSYVAGGADDWADYGWNANDPQCGTDSVHRFDTTKQKAALNAYLPAFFRLYLGHENQFAQILEVNNIIPPASSLLDSSDVYVSYHAAKVDRLDVNRTDSTDRLTQNSLHGAVADSLLGLPAVCGAGYSMFDCAVSNQPAQEPNRGTGSTPGAGEMSLHWNDTAAWYDNYLPAANQNLTPYEDLMFRATVNFKLSTRDSIMNCTVQLIDSEGHIGSQDLRDHSYALFFEPGNTATDLPKTHLNTVNIPLADFAGVKLAKVEKIRFLFNKYAAGAVLISDLAFTNPLCGNFTANFKDTVGTRFKETFTNMNTDNVGSDSLTYLWNFGNTASGVNDTSTLPNPTHIFTGKGSYTTCLYVTAFRKNGLVCADTFCKTITLLTDGLPAPNPDRITISPNPARDFLFVNGAAKTDQLKLMNIYGQIVFTATITQPQINLPQSLTNGIYSAIIITDEGAIYKKLLIMK